jgi:hypothetical protein
VVSGVGRLAAAAATAYLEAFLGETGDRPWLNVGVAGHSRLPLGTPVLAHKISSRDRSDRWYPGLLVDWSGESAEVCTVSSPDTDYPGDCLYDMEAAGFYAMACRFSSVELVHCFKVVSDNASAPVCDLTPERAATVVAEAIPSLESLLSGLLRLEAETRVMREAPAGFDEALRRWHFTVSQGHRLRRALRRYGTLTGEQPDWPRGLSKASGSEVLAWLEAAVAASPMRLVKDQT